MSQKSKKKVSCVEIVGLIKWVIYRDRLSLDLETLSMAAFTLNCTPFSCSFWDVYNAPDQMKSDFSSNIH